MQTTKPLMFILSLIGLNLGLRGQAQTTTPTIVEVGLAQHVATQHVHANNQPYQWHALDYIVLYDIDGNPNAYAFVFSKTESRFKVPIDLRRHMEARMPSAGSKQLKQAQGSVDTDNNLFAFDDLATVITGATTDSSLILRHFRGLPEFWIEAAKVRISGASGKQADRTPVNIIMVTPMDFRLLAVNKGASVTHPSAAKPTSRISVLDSDQTVGVESKKVERISALRQQKQERDTRSRQRIDSMTADQNKRQEEALRQRYKSLRNQWSLKRMEWQNNIRSEEEQQ
jgi:hypothetical protein